MKTLLYFALGLGLLLSSCMPAVPHVATAQAATVLPGTVIQAGGANTPIPFATPLPPTLIPPLPSGSSPTNLKYRLLARYPDFFFCDPDYYPVARADEGQLALQRFSEIQADTEEFQSILNHNGLNGLTVFTDAQKLLIYQDYKKLAAIQFELVGDKYQFQLRTKDPQSKGFAIKGLIDAQGNITVQERTPTFATCPICLAAHTQIDTPNGSIAVENLHVGDLVWTANTSGARTASTVLEVVKVPVPAGHQMVHLVLADGRELWASPGHPTTDSRALGDLKAGDLLDEARVVLAERMPYNQSFTYDLLPSGGTGFYWANGILIGSTLMGK